MPSSSTRRPLPPASTTPASASTGSSVGVRSRLCVASSTMASSTATTSPAAASRAWFAATADSRMTVRIVPSAGLVTALYAPADPSSIPRTQAAASTLSAPSIARAMPRMIWARMTPELPPAPLCAPRVLHDGAHGEVHVRAGVAVRHGKDVDRVDGIGVLLQPGGGGGEHLAELAAGECFDGHAGGHGSPHFPEVAPQPQMWGFSPAPHRSGPCRGVRRSGPALPLPNADAIMSSAPFYHRARWARWPDAQSA